MKMKNIFLALALAVPSFVFVSCQGEEDDVFSESSSLRLQQAMDEALAVLREPEYGWVLDYYVGDDQEYGGVAMTVKFDSLTCTVASESILEECTSYYKMTNDNGPVVTFDTYNKVLHEMATPSASNYEAYHADFSFVVMSATSDLVVLRGSRIGNYAYLRPLEEPALDYLAKVIEIQDSIYASTAIGVMGNDTITATFDYTYRQVEFTSSADSSFSETRAYVFTDKGIRLYGEVSVDGSTLDDFSYHSDGMLFTSLNATSTGFTMEGHLPDDYVEFEAFEGSYELLYYLPIDENNPTAMTINVELTPSNDGQSYIMSGLSSEFDVVLEYNKQAGALEWNSQVVGEYNGYLVWLNALNWAQGGYLYIGDESYGMVTEWNGDSENPVYNWVTNDNENLSTDSFCMWLTDESGTSYGQFTSWSINGYALITYVTSLTKIN